MNLRELDPHWLKDDIGTNSGIQSDFLKWFGSQSLLGRKPKGVFSVLFNGVGLGISIRTALYLKCLHSQSYADLSIYLCYIGEAGGCTELCQC